MVGSTNTVVVEGCSASEKRAPRMLELAVDNDVLEANIHVPSKPNEGQRITLPLSRLRTAFTNWIATRIGPISLEATSTQRSIPVQFIVDAASEIEMQAGRYWIWIDKGVLRDAFASLGIEAPW
jgi:hypothetical protein